MHATIGGVLARVKQWARTIKRDVQAIGLAARDPRVPWYAKVLAATVVAYALSPIDLIPDFIPVVGYLDDLVIVPAGILLTVRLIPADLLNEFRAQAEKRSDSPLPAFAPTSTARPRSRSSRGSAPQSSGRRPSGCRPE